MCADCRKDTVTPSVVLHILNWPSSSWVSSLHLVAAVLWSGVWWSFGLVLGTINGIYRLVEQLLQNRMSTSVRSANNE